MSCSQGASRNRPHPRRRQTGGKLLRIAARPHSKLYTTPNPQPRSLYPGSGNLNQRKEKNHDEFEVLAARSSAARTCADRTAVEDREHHAAKCNGAALYPCRDRKGVGHLRAQRAPHIPRRARRVRCLQQALAHHAALHDPAHSGERDRSGPRPKGHWVRAWSQTEKVNTETEPKIRKEKGT